LPDAARAQFLRYAALLREWNEKINLTAITDDEGIAVRHLLDSLTLLPDVRDMQARFPNRQVSLVDVGTGAGFPGLPLKIACPELDVVLVDSLAKRVRFLETVIAELGLKGIRAVHGRAEDAARDKHLREKFDLATARAVAPLPVLCEYCLPFVRTGGQFLAMKGQAADEMEGAARAIKILGGELAAITVFQLPGTDMNRTIIRIAKIWPTPGTYPRKAGKVEKDPL
jgi:16S rRNA (guanine527-N7)-methyltransferase